MLTWHAAMHLCSVVKGTMKQVGARDISYSPLWSIERLFFSTYLMQGTGKHAARAATLGPAAYA